MADGYDALIRVSRVGKRGGESFISPDVQADQIKRWAAYRNVTILAEHVDLDQSGAKMDRPGLEAALRRVERGISRGIVVAKLDRLARSLPGALDVIARIERAGGELVSVAEGVDPTAPAGKMMQRLLLVLAEWELDRIRDNWHVARARAIDRGVHISGWVPTGYERGATGRLEPDEWAPAITEAFRLRAAGTPWAQVARFLDSQHVPLRTGAAGWRGRAVQSLIANRAYLGEARSGPLVNPNAHEPLTDPATFARAQSARGLPSGRSPNPGLLNGLLRCAGCRYLMSGDRHQRHGRWTIHSYRCRRDHAPGQCEAPATISGRLIEPHIVEAFFAKAGDLQAHATALTSGLSDARHARIVEEAELAAYRDDERILGVLGQERWLEGLAVKVSRVDAARQRESEAERVAGPLPTETRLRAMWDELSVGEQQAIMGSVIDTIFLRRGRGPVGDRVHICWAGEGPNDLPRRGRLVALTPFDWPDAPGGTGVAGLEDARERGA